MCAVGEAFRVDPEALAEAVERMAEFERYAESMLAEIGPSPRTWCKSSLDRVTLRWGSLGG
ncbi:hypothetical protein JMUB5695_03627 [Mycobacterium heckeshornense]|nr:hypothetical protein JMUB5695_03627 [Mycobacterium heckeshornense]